MIYEEKNYQDINFGIQREYFIKKARSNGYTVVDLDPIFKTDYGENKQIYLGE